MPKVKVTRAGGRIKKTRVKGKAKKKPNKQPKVNQISPAGRVLPDRIGPNPALVVVEDTTVRMMLADPRFLDAIPCLRDGKRKLSKVSKTCGRCSNRRAKARKNAMNGIRRCMVGLTAAQRMQLKKLLGARQVRIVVKGQHVTY